MPCRRLVQGYISSQERVSCVMAGDRSADYRARMAECLLQAAHATDSMAREALYEQAREWEQMAAQHDASNLSRPPQAQAQPVMQQQQQVQRRKPDDDT